MRAGPIAFLLFCLIPLGALRAQDEEAAADDVDAREWPREITLKDGNGLIMYQPEVDSWEKFRTLNIRMAVAVKLPGVEEEILGALELTARTDVDHEDRTVYIDEIKIAKATFPVEEKQAQDAERTLRLLFPNAPATVPLDRILTNMEVDSVQRKQTKINTEPPKIVMSRKNALLVLFDGEPVMEPIEGTDLKVAINTASDLFFHTKHGWYYLLYDGSWLHQKGDITGPWTKSYKLPIAFDKIPNTPQFKDVKENIPGQPIEKEDIPLVYVRTEPTELIVTYGEPTFKPIAGTQLMYVDNTESDIFLSGSDGRYYALFSGRWFRTRGKGHPLEYCTKDLPADFKKIPQDHTCGRVLVSVPGTDQAQEAGIAAQIPRTTRVKRSEAELPEVTYEGKPEFELIDGTTVAYAVNTSFDVYRTGGKYYCCEEAIWYVADGPEGPWALCDDVPDEIYKIPAEHPAHNDTYVSVYDSDDDYVEYGYLPGYYGTYYYDDVVVWGAGWRYRWRRSYWRHWWRHQGRPRPTPYARRLHWHRHATYGHGRYYDHLSQRYRRAAQVRAHHRRHVPRAGAYTSRRGNATAHRARVRRATRNPGTHAKGRSQLYAGKKGNVYARDRGKGAKSGWKYYRNGKWTTSPPPRNAQRSTRSRSNVSRQRSTQYRSYRSSRGTRTRSHRGSYAGRSRAGHRGGSRGGGGRGGGGRR